MRRIVAEPRPFVRRKIAVARIVEVHEEDVRWRTAQLIGPGYWGCWRASKADEERVAARHRQDPLDAADVASSLKNLQKPNLIFIVGLPRSGTTLLHQIISSHSEVFGAGELPILRSNFIENIFKEGWFDDMVQTGLAHAYDAVTPMSDINYSQRLKQDKQAANTPSTSGLKATNQQNVFNRRMSQVQDPYNESQDSFKKTRNAANVNERSGLDRRRARRAVGDYTKGPIDVQSSTEDVMDASGQRATDRIRTSNSAGTTDMTTVRSPGQPDRTRATITNPQGTITGERRPGLDFDLDAEDAAGSGERDFKTGATSVGGTYAESKQLQKESQDPFKRMRQLALKPYGSYRDED